MKYKVPFVNYPLQYRNLKTEIDSAVQSVLERGDLILRQDVEDFEKDLASFLGVKFAVGLDDGTNAIIFALKAAGVGPGDEVITVSHTFVASVASIVHCGATPVLIDVKEYDYLMDMDKLEKVITPKTKAVIPVHLNGRGCDMEKLMFIAKKHNLAVVEDTAQALGAKFKGKMIGSFGLASTYSFYPAKILGGVGDAGALATNDKEVYEQAILLRDHGQKTKTDIVCYGFTGRLDNLHAAILNVKFKRLPGWIERRREIAGIYQVGLSDLDQVGLPPAPDSDSRFFDVYQNYVLRAQERDELAQFLKENGVEILIKDPVALHHQKGLKLEKFKLPVSEKLAQEVISLPMYPELSNEQVRYAIDCVKRFYSNG
ncbi:MAG: DegT/DnrJ/EryC1/StrS family aminotransferase [Candidatus Omnitrophica bacterium]|nr:DegT/DnrJ/EryC1/StrS family aminotransferase [Candidatus Omnitrophota bacterium]